METTNTLQITGTIVSAYVGNNKMQSKELPGFMQKIHDTVTVLSNGSAPANREPAVPINKSVTPDHVICLEDGKKLKMLKRYLRTHYDLSPEEYRRKWGLPADYPMTAPNYAKTRSRLAKEIGLGKAATNSGRKKTTRRKK